MRWTTLIASLVFALPTVWAQKPDVEDASEHLTLLQATSWAELVARDARAGFGLRTCASALAELAQRELIDARKAAAVFALGAAHVVAERERITGLASEGKSEVRTAAILALGAYQSAVDTDLLIGLCDKRPNVADAALFALALNGTADALAHVRAVAADVNHARRETAQQALAFRAQPAAESAFARELLALRFEAARRHGLFDGQAWDTLIADDLAHSPKFLSRLIYRSASELRRPGIRDHFLEVALAGGPPDRLRGVVNAIPSEFAQLVESELYTPVDDKEWNALLSEIEQRGLEPLTEALLRRAWIVPGLRAQSSAMLARAGAPGAVQLLEVNLRSNDAAERAWAAAGLGRAGDTSYLPGLIALEVDAEPTVRAAALVARVRLGDETAAPQLRRRLALDEEQLKPRDLDLDAIATIDAVVRAASDARVCAYLVELQGKAPQRAQLAIAVELLRNGYEEARPLVRELLRTERPSGESGARAVAALAHMPSLADIAVLRDLFPLGDDLDVDAELACALLRIHDAEVLPFLRAALWNEPWNRSVLAGALWIEVDSLEGLRLEAQRPPPGASSRDLCRVGFALGEWGGVDEVQRLSQRFAASSPVLQGATMAALGARTH